MKHILAAIDFSDTTDEVLLMAKKIATAFHSELCLLHTHAPKSVIHYYYGIHGPFFMSSEKQNKEELKHDLYTLKILEHQLETIKLKPRCVLIEGEVVQSIVNEALKWKADLIIAGTHKHGIFHDLFLGNVCENLIRHCPCPVLIVPQSMEKVQLKERVLVAKV